MTNPRNEIEGAIHDAFRAHNPTLYAAIVALLDAGADPRHVTRFIDRECRRARGHGPGTVENAAAVTIEVLMRRREGPDVDAAVDGVQVALRAALEGVE